MEKERTALRPDFSMIVKEKESYWPQTPSRTKKVTGIDFMDPYSILFIFYWYKINDIVLNR